MISLAFNMDGSANPPSGQVATIGRIAPSPRLRVFVAFRGDGFNGIDTYAEQLALAALAVGHEVTLLVTTAQVAEAVRGRHPGLALRVLDAGLAAASNRELLADRVLPPFQNWRLGKALERTLKQHGPFDVVHLNRPALSRWVAEDKGRVFVTGWFYPHAPGPRLLETWRHTTGQLPRRVVVTLKSLAFYAGDARGYRAPACIVACTETLAAQLRAQGLQAVSCPPPVQETTENGEVAPVDQREVRLLVCSGDLSHPRKNLRDAVRAAGLLASSGRNVVLRAIGRQAEVLQYEARNLPSGARLELLGPKSPQEVRAEMRRANALLLPSLYEEWGYVAVESILSGTPVVSYPVYPFDDMLAGGLGVVADSIGPEALARAVEKSLSGARGPELVSLGRNRFGVAAIGTRLTEIWTGAETGR